MFKQSTASPAAPSTPPPLATGSGSGTSNGSLRARSIAALVHLTLSGAVAGAVLALVYLCWYPSPLDSVSGVGGILILLLIVDVTLGPVLTLVVFDRRKKSLPYDLACIGLVQIAALLYGIHTVEAGRPHFLVFVKDRFEVVSRADLASDDLRSAQANSFAQASWIGPRIVAAEPPTDEAERQRMLLEAVAGGRDLSSYPGRYRDVASQRSLIRSKSLDLDDLRTLNPGAEAALERAIERSGVVARRLRFLPLKGPQRDAAVLVDADSAEVVGMADLRPWR